ncbi:uncharacterized protein LOC128867044 [Anastrepha ludens]|uniref:uncharacterized protein LOC128867044 n=1 Tax=Anastrepha ludens TaxID=28586 RepID=UPI0023B0A6F0|nr:uncharacterized protein LOC128867044 [Anastrepha ludens]
MTLLLTQERIVKLLQITCNSKESQYLSFTQCKLEHKRGDVYEVTVAITLHQGPINNVTLIGSIVKSGYESRQPMLEYKIDCCAFFRNKRRSFSAKLAYDIMGLERYSNMNHSCPYDRDLLVDHYPFNGRRVGRMTPFGSGIFTFSTKWYLYNILRAVVDIRFQAIDR